MEKTNRYSELRADGGGMEKAGILSPLICSILLEHWAKERADPHARERATDIARQDPPSGVTADEAVAEIRETFLRVVVLVKSIIDEVAVDRRAIPGHTGGKVEVRETWQQPIRLVEIGSIQIKRSPPVAHILCRGPHFRYAGKLKSRTPEIPILNVATHIVNLCIVDHGSEGAESHRFGSLESDAKQTLSLVRQTMHRVMSFPPQLEILVTQT